MIGTILGNIFIGISWVLDTYKRSSRGEVYSIPYVPFHIRGWDAVLISATALLISYLATIYPARNAARWIRSSPAL